MKPVVNFTISFSSLIASTSIVLAAQGGSNDDSVSGSLLVSTPVTTAVDLTGRQPSALRAVSLFAIAPIEPRTYREHDLVQIIVRETSQAKSSQDLNTKKDSKLDGKVGKFPALQLEDLLNLQMYGGRTTNLPAVQVDFSKDFKGNGDYERKDDLSARVTAEVIEVLPNGNLVLEARTNIKIDTEEKSMKVTGICRPEDITPANTVLSNQIHDLVIDEMHKGELRENASKGIIAKVLETVFAF
jgi:flagellar L-ring protein FlgH